MANTRKIKFPASQLPGLRADTLGYKFRFRVISQDQNRKSAWSPIYSMVPNYTYQPGNIGNAVNGTILSLTWDPVGIIIDDVVVRNVNAYDIWVQWNGGTWTHYSDTSLTSSNILIPTGTTTYAIKIYHKVYPATQIEQLELYDVATTSI